MPEYRRMQAPGGTFFLTLVTYGRAPLFRAATAVELLRNVMAGVRSERPFEILGAVILPDHLHFLWELPPNDTDFSSRAGLIKARFTKALLGGAAAGTPECPSRLRHRERAVWQRRFWEHTIRDDEDLDAHMDYIHYNPVKHGVAACAHAWPYSSFHRWVRSGACAVDWCCACRQRIVRPPVFDRIARTVGE
jgi:putative transposase